MIANIVLTVCGALAATDRDQRRSRICRSSVETLSVVGDLKVLTLIACMLAPPEGVSFVFFTIIALMGFGVVVLATHVRDLVMSLTGHASAHIVT